MTSTPLTKAGAEESTSVYETPKGDSTVLHPRRNIKLPKRFEDYEMYYTSVLSASAWIENVPLGYEDIEGREDEEDWKRDLEN